MNRSQLLGNLDTNINISLLRNKLINKKVLFIGPGNLELISRADIQLRDFFDVIITTEEYVLDMLPVDIFISFRDTPYINNVLNLDFLEKNPNTLFCLSDKFTNVLRLLKQRPYNYILTCTFLENANIASEPYTVNHIKYGLSRTQISDHISMITGSKFFYIVENGKFGTERLVDYVMAKNKYGAPINLLFKDRKHFIFNW